MAEEKQGITQEQKEQSTAKFKEYFSRATAYYNQRVSALFEAAAARWD